MVSQRTYAATMVPSLSPRCSMTGAKVTLAATAVKVKTSALTGSLSRNII